MAASERIVISGAREHNLKDVDVELPRDALIVDHRPLRVRQVEPCLRHDLRRGAAPLRRVAVLLRAAVPRPDGEARRRLDRGPLAGDLDRPEDDLAQPALDGRHRDRDLRLPAPALGADRHPVLPRVRRGDHRPDPGADRRPADDARGGDQIHGHGAGRPRPQRRVREIARADAARGLLAGQGQRRAAPPRRGDRARQEVQTRRLDRRRPPGDEDGPAAPPLGVGRSRGRPRGRADRSRDPRRAQRRQRSHRKSRRNPALLRAVRLPQLRHLDPRAGAADLLLQLAARRLRPLPRPRLPAGDRPRAGRPRPDALARRGRAAALEPRHHRLLEAADRLGRRELRRRRRQALVAAVEERAGDLPLRHRRRAPPRQLHQPLRPPPLLQGPLRGDRQQPAAPLRGDRLGVQPRADRGLHGRAAMPRLQGRPAAAGEPRGQGRRRSASPSTATSPPTPPPSGSATWR